MSLLFSICNEQNFYKKNMYLSLRLAMDATTTKKQSNSLYANSIIIIIQIDSQRNTEIYFHNIKIVMRVATSSA